MISRGRGAALARQVHCGVANSSILSKLKDILPLTSKKSESLPDEFLQPRDSDAYSFTEKRTFEVKTEPYDPTTGRAIEEEFASRNALRVARHGLGVPKRVAVYENFAGRFLVNGKPAPPFHTVKAAEGDVYDFINGEKSTDDIIVHDRLELISFGVKDKKGRESMVIKKFKGLKTPATEFWTDI